MAVLTPFFTRHIAAKLGPDQDHQLIDQIGWNGLLWTGVFH